MNLPGWTWKDWLQPVPVAMLLCGSGALAFLWLAEEVAEQEYQALDRAILLALRDPADPAMPIGPPWLLTSMTDITALGGYTVLTLIVAFACAYMVAARQRRAALVLLAASLSGTLVSTLVKMLFDRARPDLVPHLVPALSPSFPSGHAMLSATIFLTAGALAAQVVPRRRMAALILGFAVLLTVLVGASRVYLGVHWPSDVVAGWLLGMAWAALWWLAERYLDRRAAR